MRHAAAGRTDRRQARRHADPMAVAGSPDSDRVPITLVSVNRSTIMHFETPLEYLESRTYDEINVGDSSSLVRTLRPEDVKLFALMSGDMNPALASTEFRHSGLFQDFIAHGMWTKARCLAAYDGRLPKAFRVDVQFKLPVLLPAKVAFQSCPDGKQGAQFALADAKNGKPHLAGTITAL